MAGFEIEGPDGRVHSFAEGTPPEAAMARMQSMYGKGRIDGGAPAPTPPPSPPPGAGLPQPGQATALTGAAAPSMNSMPPYRTPADEENLMLQIALGGKNRGIQPVLQNTPGHAFAMEHAKTVGKELGALEERQRAGRDSVLPIFNDLKDVATKTQTEDPDAFNHAIGRWNQQPGMQLLKSGVSAAGSPMARGADVANRMDHLIDGLTTAFMSSAARNGMQMSDARMKTFEKTMGLMRDASNAQEFNKIMHDAEGIIRRTFSVTDAQAGSAPRQTAAPAPVRVSSPEEAAKLAPGTPFIAHDGRAMVRQ